MDDEPKVQIGMVAIPILKANFTANNPGLDPSQAWLKFANAVLQETCQKLYQVAVTAMEENDISVSKIPKDEVKKILKETLDIQTEDKILSIVQMDDGRILHDEDAERNFAEGKSFNN